MNLHFQALCLILALILNASHSFLEAKTLLYLRILAVSSQQDAAKAQGRLEAGEAFSAVARDLSIDPSASKGGFLGGVILTRLNEQYRQVALSLEPGHFSPFFRSGRDWVSLYRMPSRFREQAWNLQMEGDRLRKEGNFAAAIAAYDQALDVFPDFIHALFGRGVAHGELGNTQKEIEDYHLAILREPSFHMAHYNLGKALMTQGDSRGAARAFREALRARPDLPEAHVNLSAIALAEGNSEVAAREAEAAVRLNPVLSSAYYNLGLALAAKDLASALENFRTAAIIDPNRLDARLNAAIALAQLGRRAEALEQIRAILADQPDFEAAQRALAQLAGPVDSTASSNTGYSAANHVDLGKQALQQGRVREGLDHFERAYQLEPSAEIRNQLAWVQVAWGKELQTRGQWHSADQAWSRALQIEADFLPALKALALAKIIEGDFSAAERFINRAWAGYPGQAELVILRSRLAYERREIEVAFGELTRLDFSSLDVANSLRLVEQLLYLDLDEEADKLLARLQLQPRERFELANTLIKFDRFEQAEEILLDLPAASARLLLGRLYSQQLRFEEAEAVFQQILDQNESNWPAYFFLGQVYLDAGEAEKAVPLYQRAHQLQPDNVNVLYKLANACSRSGLVDEATKWLQRGLALEPSSYQLNFEMAKILLEEGKTAQAKLHFSRVLDREPDHIRTHYLLGRAYQIEGDSRTARFYLEKFTELKRQLEAGRERLNSKKDALKGRKLIS